MEWTNAYATWRLSFGGMLHKVSPLQTREGTQDFHKTTSNKSKKQKHWQVHYNNKLVWYYESNGQNKKSQLDHTHAALTAHVPS